MAEFLTMDEAKSKFGTKGRTNAGQKSLTFQLQERSTYKLLNLMLFTISNTLIVKEM